MTERILTLTSNNKFSFEVAWEVPLATMDYHANRFTSFLLGADFFGEKAISEDT